MCQAIQTKPKAMDKKIEVFIELHCLVQFFSTNLWKIWNINVYNVYVYNAFLGTQSTLHERGESPHPPPVCSIQLDDATAAILH